MILCITGPSGSGKTTIANLLKDYNCPELVSTTTRPMRINEIDGVAYHFVTIAEFYSLDTIEDSYYDGNLYGMTREEVASKTALHDVCVFVSDIHGIRKIKEVYPEITRSVFLNVTLEEMKERMLNRGDSIENVEKRIHHALDNKELENGKYCDYIVRNSHLPSALSDVLEIIRAEKNLKKEA